MFLTQSSHKKHLTRTVQKFVDRKSRHVHAPGSARTAVQRSRSVGVWVRDASRAPPHRTSCRRRLRPVRSRPARVPCPFLPGRLAACGNGLQGELLARAHNIRHVTHSSGGRGPSARPLGRLSMQWTPEVKTLCDPLLHRRIVPAARFLRALQTVRPSLTVQSCATLCRSA